MGTIGQSGRSSRRSPLCCLKVDRMLRRFVFVQLVIWSWLRRLRLACFVAGFVGRFHCHSAVQLLVVRRLLLLLQPLGSGRGEGAGRVRGLPEAACLRACACNPTFGCFFVEEAGCYLLPSVFALGT